MPHDHYHSPATSTNNHTPDDHIRHLFHQTVLHFDKVILLLYIVCVSHYNNYYSPTSNNNSTDNHFRHLFHPPILRFV
jgi:hypothetical protein